MSQNVTKSSDKDKLQVILYDMIEGFKSIQSSDCDIVSDDDRTDIQEIIDIISNKKQKENKIAN